MATGAVELAIVPTVHGAHATLAGALDDGVALCEQELGMEWGGHDQGFSKPHAVATPETRQAPHQ